MSNLKMVQVGTDINDNPVYNVVDENDKLVTTIFDERSWDRTGQTKI
jgi:hypothetical protein